MFTLTDALRNFIQTTCYIRRIRRIQTVFKSLRNDNVVNAETSKYRNVDQTILINKSYNQQ